MVSCSGIGFNQKAMPWLIGFAAAVVVGIIGYMVWMSHMSKEKAESLRTSTIGPEESGGKVHILREYCIRPGK